MNYKNLTGLFSQTGDTEANWNNTVDYVPLDKQIIIYKPDDTHDAPRIKIGDGITTVQNLPFAADIEPKYDEEIKNLTIGQDFKSLYSHIDNISEIIAAAATFFIFRVASDSIKAGDVVYIGENLIEVPIDNVDYIDGQFQCYNWSFSGGAQFSVGDKIYSKGHYTINKINNCVIIDENAHQQIATANDNIELLKQQVEDIGLINGSNITLKLNFEYDEQSIDFSSLPGIKKIDWGDGSCDTLLQHTYQKKGLYTCIIYGPTTINSALSGLNSLISVEISNGITTIGSSAFGNCFSLTNVVIGDSVTSIGDNAFSWCDRLMSVDIGAGVTTIGDSAFYNCSSLMSIVIPDSVTAIGESTFSWCNSLTSAVIGDSVTSIGQYAFEGCSSLTSVVIGNNVTTINDYAFYDCGSLTNVSFKNQTPITYSSSWFDYYTALTHIYVPYGTSEAYKTKWAADGAGQAILDLIIESDREAMISDLNAALDTKLDKKGGVIDGNLAITGNLVVAGTTTTQDTETVLVKNNIVVTNSDGLELIEPGGFAIKTSSIDGYGIMYDPIGDGVKIGVGTFDDNGKFIYTTGQDQFLATRADEIVNGNIPKWDNNAKQFIDSGAKIEDCVKKTDSATTAQIEERIRSDKFLSPYYINKIVKVGLVGNTETLTDEEKTSACDWIGAFKDVAIGRELDNVLVWSQTKGWHTAIIDAGNGLALASNGSLVVSTASDAQIVARKNKPLSGDKLDLAVTEVLTNYQGTAWTEEQKAKAIELLGGVQKYTASGGSYLYGANPSGDYMFFTDAAKAQAWSIAQRGAGGILFVGTPTADGHATTKAYVDNGFVARQKPTTKNSFWLYGIRVDADGNSIEFLRQAAGSLVSDAIPIYGLNGTLRVATPTADAHATPKSYVDGGFVARTTGTYKVYGRGFSDAEYVWSVGYGPNANTIMMRNGQGRSSVEAPIEDKHIANKKYVDDAIANAGGGSSTNGKLYRHLISMGCDDGTELKFVIHSTKADSFTYADFGVDKYTHVMAEMVSPDGRFGTALIYSMYYDSMASQVTVGVSGFLIDESNNTEFIYAQDLLIDTTNPTSSLADTYVEV